MSSAVSPLNVLPLTVNAPNSVSGAETGWDHTAVLPSTRSETLPTSKSGARPHETVGSTKPASFSGKGTRKKGKADALLGKTPDIQLVTSADRGALQDVETALRDGAKVNFKLDDRTTALCRAVDRYHLDVVELLLEHNADPYITDHEHKNAFYYAFFSASASNESLQIKMVQMLLKAVGTPNAQVMVMGCYYAGTRPALTMEVVSCIQFKILSKDARDYCEFEVSGLELLDDPTCTVEWPDGSTSAGKSALHVLVEKCVTRKEMISHPVVKALLLWKWQKYGRWIEIFEWGLLIAMVASATVSTYLLSTALTHYGTEGLKEAESHDALQIVSDIMTFVCISINTIEAIAIEYGITPSYLRSKFLGRNSADSDEFAVHRKRSSGNMKGLLIPVVLWILTLISGALQANRMYSGVFGDLRAFIIVMVWLRAIHYMQLLEVVGPLFIMMEEILQHDVMLFFSLVAVNVPGFSLAMFLVSFDQGHEEGEESWTLGDTFFRLLISMAGLDPALIERVELLSSPASRVLLFGFVVLVPLLSLNLLIAMMNHTYVRVQRSSTQEHALRVARYLTTREGLTKAPYYCQQLPKKTGSVGQQMRERGIFRFFAYESHYKELVLFSGQDEMQQLESIISTVELLNSKFSSFGTDLLQVTRETNVLLQTTITNDKQIMPLLHSVCEKILSPDELKALESAAILMKEKTKRVSMAPRGRASIIIPQSIESLLSSAVQAPQPLIAFEDNTTQSNIKVAHHNNNTTTHGSATIDGGDSERQTASDGTPVTSLKVVPVSDVSIPDASAELSAKDAPLSPLPVSSEVQSHTISHNRRSLDGLSLPGTPYSGTTPQVTSPTNTSVSPMRRASIGGAKGMAG